MYVPLYATDSAFYAAFRLERILMVSALGEYAQLYEQSPDTHLRTMVSQNIQLMTNLLRSGDERFTYDLRITSHPNASKPSLGTIEIHCIIAMRCDAADAQIHANSVYRLFNAHFRDLVWQVVDDVASVLAGIPVRHAVSLMRKSGFILTESHTRANHNAFGMVKAGAGMPSSRHAARERMFYISPFIHSESQPHELFDYLLQHPQPVSISIRVQRTQFHADELRFCQENLATFDDTQNYPAAVAEQISTYQRIMNASLLRSYTTAALLNIDIVSADFVPEHLITLIGGIITQPSGGLFKSAESTAHPIQYHGGYDIVHHSDYLPVAKAFATVQMRQIAPSLYPVLDRLPHIVDVNEAAMAFRFPRSSLVPLPGVKMQSNRQLRPPSELSAHGTIIGEYREHGMTTPIRLSEIDRTRHAYVIGQTGTGKSTVLKSMILDDIHNGRGVCAIDPHGDLINDVLAQIPPHRRDDVIVVDPTQSDAPVGLNLFEYENQEEREIAIQLFQKTIELIEYARGTKPEYMGPVFWQHLRNNAYWVTQDANDPGTIIELYNMYAIKDYHKRWEPFDSQDSKLSNWHNVLKTNSYHRQGDDGHSTFSYFSSKFEDFIFDTRLRMIFGQKQSTFNFFEAMNTQKIVLINLSRGLLSEIASAFMGGVIMAKLQQAALKRAALPAEARRLFAIYVDEFQNYTSDSFISLLSESRKYGIALTLANQFLSQIENPKIISAILGNVGTVIAFRVGIQDGEYLRPRFAPEVTPNDLINLPNWQAYVSTQIKGQSQRPFSMQTIQPLEELDTVSRASMLAQSKRRYGRVRSEVERIIAQSMSTERVLPPVVEEPPAYHVQIEQHPLPHERITRTPGDTQVVAVHGAGLSLWQAGTTSSPATFPLKIGMHPEFINAMYHTPINDILPYRHALGEEHELFSTWVKPHINTLAEAIHHTHHQQQIGEENKSIINYLHPLTGYAMHQHRPSARWIDIALTSEMAVALDDTNRAFVWNNRLPNVAHVCGDIIAIAGGQVNVYLLGRDGVVQCCTLDGIHTIDLPAPITRIYGGLRFILALDIHDCVHQIHVESRIMRWIKAIPENKRFQFVACGIDHIVAYTTDNQVVAWGKNDMRSCEVPAELVNSPARITALAAGLDSSFALDEHGHVYAWGWRILTDETLAHLNTHGVQSITCHGIDFIACTKDGTWWHNNQPFVIPATLNGHHIRRVASNESSFFAIREIDTNDVLVSLMALPIADIEAIALDVKAALTDHDIRTMYQLLQTTTEELTQITVFAEHQDKLTHLIAHVHGLLTSLKLPLLWPDHILNPSTLAPNQPAFGWYVNAFSNQKRRTSFKSTSDNSTRQPWFVRRPQQNDSNMSDDTSNSLSDRLRRNTSDTSNQSTDDLDDFDEFFRDLDDFFRDLD